VNNKKQKINDKEKDNEDFSEETLNFDTLH
jgi:hypothetical protein